jgi:hypothetical protein
VYEADLVANPAAESMVKPVDGLHGASNYRFVKEKYVDLAYYSEQAHYNHVNEKELPKTPNSPTKGASLSLFIKKGQSDVVKKGSGSKSVCSATVDSTLDGDSRSLCQFSTKNIDLTPKYNGSSASSLQSSCGSLDFRQRDRGDSGNFMEEANKSMLIKKPGIHNDPRRAAFHQSKGNLDFSMAEGDDDDIPEDSNEIEQDLRLNTSSKDVKKSKKRISVLASKSIPAPRLPQNKRMGLYSVNQRGRSSSRTRDGQRGRSMSRARDNPLDKADNGQSRSSARTLESGHDRLPKRRGRSNSARSIASSADIAKNRSQPSATDPADSDAVRRRRTSTSRANNRLESSARKTPVSSARSRSSSIVRTRRSGDSTLSGSSACLDVPSIAHEVSKKPSARGSSRSSSKIRSRGSEDHGLNGSSARLDAAARPRSALGRSSSTSRLNSPNLDNTNESSASPSSLATNARRRRSPSRKANRSTPSADSSGGSQDRETRKDGLRHDDQDAKLQRRSRSSSRGAVDRRPQSYSKSKGVTSEVSSEKKVGTRDNRNAQFRPKSTDRLNASSQSLSLDSVHSKKNEGLSDYIPEDDGDTSFQVIPGSSNHQRSSYGANKIGSDKGSKSFTAPYISKSDLKPASEYESERRRSSRGKLAGINVKRTSRKSDIFASLDREEDEVNQQMGPLMRRQFKSQSMVSAGPLQVRAPPRRTTSDTGQFRGIVNTASKKTYNF